MIVDGVGLVFKVIFMGVGHGFDERLSRQLRGFNDLFQKISSQMVRDGLKEEFVFFIRVVTHRKNYIKSHLCNQINLLSVTSFIYLEEVP